MDDALGVEVPQAQQRLARIHEQLVRRHTRRAPAAGPTVAQMIDEADVDVRQDDHQGFALEALANEADSVRLRAVVQAAQQRSLLGERLAQLWRGVGLQRDGDDIADAVFRQGCLAHAAVVAVADQRAHRQVRSRDLERVALREREHALGAGRATPAEHKDGDKNEKDQEQDAPAAAPAKTAAPPLPLSELPDAPCVVEMVVAAAVDPAGVVVRVDVLVGVAAVDPEVDPVAVVVAPLVLVAVAAVVGFDVLDVLVAVDAGVLDDKPVPDGLVAVLVTPTVDEGGDVEAVDVVTANTGSQVWKLWLSR
eukprot:m.71239 g.71239  ORF g.71239 m.71239 type:complete len:308 (-) comp7627_c0_seq3:585-1508(-)